MRRADGSHTLPDNDERRLLGTNRDKISVVTPCFNEELNIADCHRAVREVFERELPDCDYEHVFSDNASSDGTVAMLRELAGTSRG